MSGSQLRLVARKLQEVLHFVNLALLPDSNRHQDSRLGDVTVRLQCANQQRAGQAQMEAGLQPFIEIEI